MTPSTKLIQSFDMRLLVALLIGMGSARAQDIQLSMSRYDQYETNIHSTLKTNWFKLPSEPYDQLFIHTTNVIKQTSYDLLVTNLVPNWIYSVEQSANFTNWTKYDFMRGGKDGSNFIPNFLPYSPVPFHSGSLIVRVRKWTVDEVNTYLTIMTNQGMLPPTFHHATNPPAALPTQY